MSNTFKTLCQSCGFKMMEAADFLAVSPNTAKSWWLGTRTCPDGVKAELFDLILRQERAAEEAVEIIEAAIDKHGLPQSIPVGVSADDHEAQSHGWPCVSAHLAVVRRMIEMLEPDVVSLIEIVPLGSTPETAAAADAHGK